MLIEATTGLPAALSASISRRITSEAMMLPPGTVDAQHDGGDVVVVRASRSSLRERIAADEAGCPLAVEDLAGGDDDADRCRRCREERLRAHVRQVPSQSTAA